MPPQQERLRGRSFDSIQKRVAALAPSPTVASGYANKYCGKRQGAIGRRDP